MAKPPHSIRVEAVVLQHSDWGEADRLLTVFSREQGKLRCVAKGVRRMRSRKAGHLEPFTRVVLLLASSHSRWIITQAEAIDVYLSLRENLLHTAYAASVVELLDRFIYEDGQNLALYRLLVSTLERIDQNRYPFAAIRYYEIHLLDVLGYRPELHTCTGCGEPIIAQDQAFSCLTGGVLCPRCARRSDDAGPISMEALKYLRHFQRSSFEQAAPVRFSQAVLEEVQNITQRYLVFLLERGLNARDFLHSIQK